MRNSSPRGMYLLSGVCLPALTAGDGDEAPPGEGMLRQIILLKLLKR